MNAFDPSVEFESLSLELQEGFRSWESEPGAWSPERDEHFVRRAFRLQYESSPAYRAYCERRRVTPSNIRSWRHIPAVPTAAFREIDLALQGIREPETVFRTSGTTRGRHRRGRHAILDLELYRASLEAVFRAQALDGETEVPILSLVPPFTQSGDSSLAWMCDALISRFGSDGSERAANAEDFDWSRAAAFVERACSDGIAVCILATTLAADAWLRYLAETEEGWTLPAGSRLMDTGGEKGRPGLTRSAVVDRIQRRLGIPPDLVINEFGMTELLSQRYSRPLPANRGAEADEPARLHGPPWLRTRALDPETLEELPDGDLGVLCHFDLANLGSVCAVLTEDLGRVSGRTMEWVGRAPGAPPRGCSLAAADILAVAEAGPHSREVPDA
jgi:hypothetical protein